MVDAIAPRDHPGRDLLVFSLLPFLCQFHVRQLPGLVEVLLGGAIEAHDRHRPLSLSGDPVLLQTLWRLRTEIERHTDGIDQTSLLLHGDAHGRRDYAFIYAGSRLGASVKGDFKRHWISPDPVGEASGIPSAFYFLPADPRESSPMLVNLIHLKSPFNRMKLRHDLWKQRYPDSKERHGIPWTGIENATPELKALANPRVDRAKLPFDPLEYVEHLDELPFDPELDPGLGR